MYNYLGAITDKFVNERRSIYDLNGNVLASTDVNGNIAIPNCKYSYYLDDFAACKLHNENDIIEIEKHINHIRR